MQTYEGRPATISAGTCFKAGFMGAFGVFCFGLLVSIVLLIVSAIAALIFGASLLQLIER